MKRICILLLFIGTGVLLIGVGLRILSPFSSSLESSKEVFKETEQVISIEEKEVRELFARIKPSSFLYKNDIGVFQKGISKEKWTDQEKYLFTLSYIVNSSGGIYPETISESYFLTCLETLFGKNQFDYQTFESTPKYIYRSEEKGYVLENHETDSLTILSKLVGATTKGKKLRLRMYLFFQGPTGVYKNPEQTERLEGVNKEQLFSDSFLQEGSCYIYQFTNQNKQYVLEEISLCSSK